MPTTITPRRLVAASLTLCLVVLAGCGDDDPAAAPADPTEATDPTDTSAPPDDEPVADPATAGPDPADPSDAPTTETPAAEDPDAADPGSREPVDEPGIPRSRPRADTRDDTAEPSEFAMVTPTDVRIGSDGVVDRVVVEVGGRGTPGWSVGYADDPRTHGEGAEVDLEGDAVLAVVLTGAAYPSDSGVAYVDGPRLLSSSATSAVTQVQLAGIFEGQAQLFVGVDTERPFRAYLLTDPTRVVIEVVR